VSYFPERRHARIETHKLAWVFSLKLPEAPPPEKPLRLEARNISAGGLKFHCNRRFQLFENLSVAFFEKMSGTALPALEGKVVRVEEIDTGFGEKTYGVALEFMSGSEELAALLPGAPVKTEK